MPSPTGFDIDIPGLTEEETQEARQSVQEIIDRVAFMLMPSPSTSIH